MTKIGPVYLYILFYKITTKGIVKNTYYCMFFAMSTAFADGDLVVCSYRKLVILNRPGGEFIARPDIPAKNLTTTRCR